MKKNRMTAIFAAAALALAGCGAQEAETKSAEAGTEETKSMETETEEAKEAEAPAEEETKSAETELTVFAAASLTETLTEISELYKEEHPEITLTFNFDSSGTLKTQIQEGAACDLFLSAGQKQMNQLDIEADPEVNTEGLDYVLGGSRINLLENKVTLCVPEENPANLESFDDLAEALKGGDILMAMGNGDVPVGQYTQKILNYYELSEEELSASGVISYGSNVKEVTTQIAEGSVDCGVIYCTDAYSEGLKIVDSATAEMCGQVIYPAAVLKTGEHQKEAQEFLDFLKTQPCMEIFEKVGFVPAG